MKYYDEIGQSIKTGFLDHTLPSQKGYVPQLLTNDKTAGTKILSTIHKELRGCYEFWFSVAFVTKSGVATIINLLQELKERGTKGKILVSQYLNFTQPEALRTLLQFDNINLRIITKGDFHAKGYLFKKETGFDLIIGSSNLTDSALCANKEWNLKVSATANSTIIRDAETEFDREFNSAEVVDRNFTDRYEKIYQSQERLYAEREAVFTAFEHETITPNKMQEEALQNLQEMRNLNIEKALLISATGTGKTYLSAFDVKKVNPRKFLFIVHRANIAEAAMKSFQRIFGKSRTMGLYGGNVREVGADFLFSTIQTISRDENLSQFDANFFDYIVIDETHRAGAPSYQKILSHFQPKFLLGMTATPERTDNFNIFKQFDYNIAYEIRLNRALEEEMLCPFHYYGVTDVSVGNQIIDDKAAFNLLVAEERVGKIIEKSNFYGCDNGNIKGLIFCSKVLEAQSLAAALNKRGFRTLALSGENSETERSNAIIRLESDGEDKLDYILTVDIFNEGIDIPKVNQIIMLRPTQSAIVFVQQLGRGLRISKGKDYLTVIDFIGNYSNNYLVPIALFGDNSYNKDHLRKLMASGSSLIPGASTVDFDPITREKIFASIDSAKMSNKKDLDHDYDLLKFKIGKPPMMIDFLEHGSRDPYLYVDYDRSYFNYASGREDELKGKLSLKERKILELISMHIANAKRVEEVIILKNLIFTPQITISALREQIHSKYNITIRDHTVESCLLNLNFKFVNSFENIVSRTNEKISLSSEFKDLLLKDYFRTYLEDLLRYAETVYDERFKKTRYIDGFLLYEKYTRKDVLRILNWDKNPPPLNVGGYILHPKKSACPIFVTYKKREDISETVKYEDKFLSNHEFLMISKSKRTLDSPDVQAIKNYKSGLRLPLFIQKSNDEGVDFYYMGDLTPKENGFIEDLLPIADGKKVNIVKITFLMNTPVEDSMYEYLTNNSD